MIKEFTKSQEELINNCSNVYLKLIYKIDFLFKNNNLKEKLCEVLNETNKTQNVEAKMIYLYIVYKVNTLGYANRLDITFPSWLENILKSKDKKEQEDIMNEFDKLRIVEAIHLKNILIPNENDIQLNDAANLDIKPKIDYNLKHLRKIKVKYDNFRLNKKIERKINYD